VRWEIGRIIAARGLGGELKLRLFRPDATALEAGRLILVHPDRGERELAVRAARQGPGGVLSLSLEGIGDREAAEAWIKAQVWVEADWFAPGTGPLERLIGGEAIDADTGSSLGAITGIEDNGAQALLVIGDGEHAPMVPLVDAFIASIEEAPGARPRVRIRAIPGLLGD
jgi:ribosomal 30S subunit maturation factor RimM